MEVSAVLCTYNRADLLPGALTSILDQSTAIPFELIVVDNNSTDNTAETIHSFEERDARVRYCFEPKQGLSHARNAGIAAARAEIIAFTDDDVRANPDWIERTLRVFQTHPEIGYAGGKVLPLWPKQPPSWLTTDHWSPLALVDYGDSPFVIPTDFHRVIVGANLSFRRQALRELGGFRPELQRVKDGIGSMEDQDIQERYWAKGGLGRYEPGIEIRAEIQPNRLDKQYHRRWRKGYGRFSAMAGDEFWEKSSIKIFGITRSRYRSALTDCAKWIACSCLRRHDEAFLHETRFLYGVSYISTRLRQRFRKTSE